MTQTKKKTLLFLGITVLLLFFVISIMGQSAGQQASAAEANPVVDVQEAIDSVLSNGKTPSVLKNEGTPISTAGELRTFLQSGYGKAYLTNDILDFSWDGKFTKQAMSENATELSGNGHKIILTASGILDSARDVHVEELFDWAENTYVTTTDYYSVYLDLFGGFIGYLRQNQTIRDINFEYNKSFNVEFSTNNSCTLGLIAAYSVGTIDNCSLTIGSSSSITIKKNSSRGGAAFANSSNEQMSKHSFAMGGFVGTLTHNGVVKNSKVVHNGNFSVTVNGKMSGSTAYHDGYSRAWVGGFVGWSGNDSSIFNIVTQGSGNLEAKAVNDDQNRARCFSGIVAGAAASEKSNQEGSLTGYCQNGGRINGVINNWTGYAKFLVTSNIYSPNGTRENSVRYLVVGVAGTKDDSNSNISNIYMTKDVYKGTEFSIAYDFSVTPGTNGKYQGRYYSTNIFIKDVLDKQDGSEDYKPASENHAYLTFSGTAISSPVWAVYDISDVDVILWSKEVSGPINTKENYFNLANSIEDAKKFDVTYTEIPRGQERGYEIRYAHGRAVYFKKKYPLGSDETNPNRVVLPEIRYGQGLSAPSLELYADKGYTQKITVLNDKDYWVSISSSNNVPVRMSDKIMSPDTYESFLFIDNTTDMDYSYVHFVNNVFRYVSYIYDDPNFIAYKEAHPGYEPVRIEGNTREKQIDWQQRAVQKVSPKIVNVDWGHPTDMDKVGDYEEDQVGNITTYGRYETTYDGEPVTFNLGITEGLLFDETCAAEYEYRVLDTYTGEYVKTDSCVNAGTYKVVVTSLLNKNYTIPQGLDYCIDFVIKKRQIGFINKIDAEVEGNDTYHIKLPYEARDIKLADEIAVFETQSDANASSARIILYNVLKKDEKILNFEYNAHGDGELNMRNVGMFEMEISLLGGISSGNYILPDITKYLVEIVEAEADFSEQTQFEYAYGNLVVNAVDPFVTVKGVDGTALTFDEITYFMEVDGEFVKIETEPFDAGVYKIQYDFLNSSYVNYKDHSITVNITINKRKVMATYTEGLWKQVEYGTNVEAVGVSLGRQSGNDGIFNYEYDAHFATFKFNKLDEQLKPTDVWCNKIIDVGNYKVTVGIDFDESKHLNGWSVNENTKYNYEVIYDDNVFFTVTVTPREVSVILNDVERSYGDEMKDFRGEANQPDSVRAWRYEEGSKTFFPGDNIVITPYFDEADRFVSVGSYKVLNDEEHRTGDLVQLYDIDGAALEDRYYNKIDNYIVTVADGSYTVVPRKVKVKVILDTDSVIYGDALPEFVEAQVVGENDFFAHDNVYVDADWGEVKVGSSVDTYYVSAKMRVANDNYSLEIEEAEFNITPRTLTIVGVHVEGDVNFKFNGTVQTPNVVAEFEEEVIAGDIITFEYNYFEIINGVMSTEATENPQYVGQYRAFIADASNPNYRIVFGDNYERGKVIMSITKRDVKLEVLPAYRIYSVEGSLTPIMRPESQGGGIHLEPGWHYYTKEEAEAIYGEDFYKPYRYASDSVDMFIQNEEQLQATMYIDEYYKELGRKNDVVKLVFNGLVPDPAYIVNGVWTPLEDETYEGEGVKILGYRNYNIILAPGDLHVLGADLKDVGQYVNLRNSQEEYNGSDRYEDFRVLTSNENIYNALDFRVFKYVAMSALSSSEANALASAYGKYTQKEVDGKFVYERNDAEGTFVRQYLRRIENGDSVDDKLVDAGQYFKHITPKKDTNIFQGEFILDFYITKAMREVSQRDVKITVHYNRITVLSAISGMEVSFNGAGYVNRNTFVDLKSDTEYTIKVRFAESTNYLQSEELEFKVRTGIDISALVATINKFDKIDFSNIDEFESKVLVYMNSISESDKSLIDQAKYAKLLASYEQLLSGAESIIAGAQQAGATAVGKSKDKANGMAVALSTGGVSIALAAGLMALKKKKEEDEIIEKKTRRVNARKFGKIIVAVVAIMIVCVTVLTGCQNNEDDQGFKREDLYKIASFQADQSEGKRNLTIEVKSSNVTLYKYENGKETVDDRLDVSSLELGEESAGYIFDDLYFVNSKFEDSEGKATFSADIRETLAFLGVANADNGKVSVVVDSQEKKLLSIDVSYDVVTPVATYNVTIAVSVDY